MLKLVEDSLGSNLDIIFFELLTLLSNLCFYLVSEIILWRLVVIQQKVGGVFEALQAHEVLIDGELDLLAKLNLDPGKVCLVISAVNQLR